MEAEHIKSAARRLGVNEHTVRRWCRLGLVRYQQTSRLTYWLARSDVDHLIANGGRLFDGSTRYVWAEP